jgi:hypothetical protein
LVESILDHAITAAEAVAVGLAGSVSEWEESGADSYQYVVRYTAQKNAFYRQIADLLELRGERERAAWFRQRQLPPMDRIDN